jgi:hypothetical protein
MKIACRLFGHTFSRATTGLTGVAGMPVFKCHCGTEWVTARGWGDAHPKRRDHFAPFIGELSQEEK